MSQESNWELPPSSKRLPSSVGDVQQPVQITDATCTDATALALFKDTSSCWTEIVDETTDRSYFFNTSTQESSWDLSVVDRRASGIDSLNTGQRESSQEHHGQQMCIPSRSQESHSSAWQNEVLKEFQVPHVVSEAVGRSGAAHVWPLTSVGNRPSRLERWDVLKAADPYREHFTTGEAWRQEHPEFEPKLSFYAFDEPVEHVERLWVEEAEAPFRCRLQREGLKFSRDITKWEKRMPLTRTDEKRDVGNVFDVDDHDDGIDQGESNMGKKSGTSEGHGAGFCAFPLVVHNSHAHHVDWTSGPDRYQITQEKEPEWGWSRLFTFFAYAASKYHVMETTESPLAQKVVKGQFLTPERGWKCVLAFFAMDDDVPGSNRYYVEEKSEPHLRTRIGMEPSCRWEARHTFAAFDIPVPGSCPLDIHYTIRSTDSLNPYPEQCRVSLKDPWGPWEQKFRFYAFPAEHVQLAPAADDLGDLGEWSASLDAMTLHSST